MGDLNQAFLNLRSAVDFECERGGEDRKVEINLRDLIEIISWIEDIKDNDHVDAAGFFRS